MNRWHRLQNRDTRPDRSGQSLIEVLVAIALLVFGVFAVLRVFPIGFTMLRQTGLQQQIQQLADSLAQEARNGETQAPDGIVERVHVQVQGGIGGWQIPNASSATAAALPVSPNTLRQNDYRQNSLFTQRTILGERFTVKANGAASLLLFGPIYFDPAISPGVPPAAPSNNDIDANIQVYDPDAYQDVTTTGYFTAPHQFLVTSTNVLNIYPYEADASATRHYLLSYRTAAQNGPTFDVVDEDVAIPANQSAAQAFVQGPPIPGTIKVCRRFPAGDGSNGTFKLVDSYVGVIQIGPYAGNGAWVIPPGGTLAVDYTTRDWQILRLEQDVPSDGTIHLPINNLDILDRQVNPAVRVMAVNINNPTQVSAISTITFPGTTPIPGSVNVREGVVYLDNTFAAGTPVRIYFAAYSTWAQQPLVSYSSYTQSSAPAGYRFFYLDTPVLVAGTTWSCKMHFPVTEVGKAVSMDYNYVDWNGYTHTQSAQTFRIQGDTPVNPTDAFLNVVYDVPGSPSSSNSVPPLNPTRVQGISFQARGVFLETGDVRRADDPTLANDNQIWNPSQVGRLGEASADVYVPRH